MEVSLAEFSFEEAGLVPGFLGRARLNNLWLPFSLTLAPILRGNRRQSDMAIQNPRQEI